jgi:cysteine-rich repeat protein
LGGAGICDEILEDGSAPEHGMCQSFGFERAVSVTNELDFDGFFEFLYLATDWDCSDYECTLTPPGSGGFVFCSGSTYVAEIECETRGIEDCDEGEDNSAAVGATCRTDCTLPRCGDGVLEGFRGEECDDGNSDNDDGCSNTCFFPRCGDTSVQGDEECDDGDDSDTDECRNDCSLQVCGDGFLADAEDCDDGELNSEEPDASCRTDCRFPRCGDGVLDTAEDCDDGNLNDRDECLRTCSLASCGDGVRHAFLGEDCDDGNDIDDDECANDCTGEVTGFGSCADGDLGSETGSPVSTGSTVGAVNDYEASCAASALAEDLSFNWVAPTTGVYDINMEGSAYDTALHIRVFPEEIMIDECVDSVQIACNDDSIFGLQSQIILEAEAGVEYLIIVDGFSTSSGNYILNIEPI